MDSFESMTNVDGVIARTADATVPVMDRGFLYGDSVYEVFRTYDGVPLLYDEHWKRFENSARLIHLDLGLTKDQMTDEIRQTVQATNPVQRNRDVYVRYTVTRGEGPVDLFPGPEPARRVNVVRDTGAGRGCRLYEGEYYPVRVIHLAVVPDDAAGYALRIDQGVQSEALVPSDAPTGWKVPGAIELCVPVA